MRSRELRELAMDHNAVSAGDLYASFNRRNWLSSRLNMSDRAVEVA